jgi:hypothetical protein
LSAAPAGLRISQRARGPRLRSKGAGASIGRAWRRRAILLELPPLNSYAVAAVSAVSANAWNAASRGSGRMASPAHPISAPPSSIPSVGQDCHQAFPGSSLWSGLFAGRRDSEISTKSAQPFVAPFEPTRIPHAARLPQGSRDGFASGLPPPAARLGPEPKEWTR